MIKSNQADSAGSGSLPADVLASAFLKGAEIWVNAQGEILSAMEAMMGDWMRRRRDAFDTWSRSLNKMCECRDPVDLVQTQQDWLRDAIRLTAFDIRALAGNTSILTSKATAAVERPADSLDESVKTRRGRLETAEHRPEERIAAE